MIPSDSHFSLTRSIVSFTVSIPTYRVGIVGATGAVGQELIGLLESREFPLAELRLLASARSAGSSVGFKGKSLTVGEATPDAFAGLDVAFFAVASSVAKALAPEAVRRGCIVIDKSSAHRMAPGVPLVVPEINPEELRGHKGIIASPNCSTAVALMALYPLHVAFGLKRYFAATYQSVSGTGADAVRELDAQIKASVAGRPVVREVYPHPIAFNVIPQVDSFGDNGYTGEETKMLAESRKILGLPELKVSATCVRVPVIQAHSIAINAEFVRPVSVPAARQAIAGFAGAELVDEPARNRYPTPLDFTRKAKCGVGRIRLDTALDNGLAIWVSGDNLWKGAALNAIQTAEKMIELGMLEPKAAAAV